MRTTTTGRLATTLHYHRVGRWRLTHGATAAVSRKQGVGERGVPVDTLALTHAAAEPCKHGVVHTTHNEGAACTRATHTPGTTKAPLVTDASAVTRRNLRQPSDTGTKGTQRVGHTHAGGGDGC
jgi:hypothetical protein